MSVPVYLFTGFLESGKTKFIQETLEDERFNGGEKTLLLLCEEGEEEYDPDLFSSPNVYIEYIDDPTELKAAHLSELLKKHACERVVIEFNGMWMLDDLYNELPENWVVAQEFMFADSNTFLSYNANMRGLVVDKLKSCELIAFNRFKPEMDKMDFHKIVRAVNQRADIAYEYPSGKVEYDDIEDPLPFDIEAPVIKVEDEHYAVWYRDIAGEPEKYKNKIIQIKGIAEKQRNLPPDSFIFGRNLMTCCVEDIRFAGLACVWEKASQIKPREWYTVTARIVIQKHKAYKGKGPVFNVISASRAEAPEQPVATFY